MSKPADSLLVALSTMALTALLASSSANASSAEATFESFNSCYRTSQEVDTECAFLSRYRTMEDSDFLQSFNSQAPRGCIMIVR